MSVQKIIKSGEPFTDSEFPPTIESIVGPNDPRISAGDK